MGLEIAALVSGIIGTAVSVTTLLILLLRGIFTLERRLTKLETQIEPFWEGLRVVVSDWLQGLRPSGNPISPERWNHLLQKLRDNVLTPEEALELNNAMVEQQEEARKKNDRSTLLALGLGLAILAPIILSSSRSR